MEHGESSGKAGVKKVAIKKNLYDFFDGYQVRSKHQPLKPEI